MSVPVDNLQCGIICLQLVEDMTLKARDQISWFSNYPDFSIFLMRKALWKFGASLCFLLVVLFEPFLEKYSTYFPTNWTFVLTFPFIKFFCFNFVNGAMKVFISWIIVFYLLKEQKVITLIIFPFSFLFFAKKLMCL